LSSRGVEIRVWYRHDDFVLGDPIIVLIAAAIIADAVVVTAMMVLWSRTAINVEIHFRSSEHWTIGLFWI